MYNRLQVDSAHAKCILLNEDCSFTIGTMSVTWEKVLPQVF